MKLLAMSCCSTKLSTSGYLPAIARYDGPMWRSLRARLADLPLAAQAVRDGDLRIIVLSAQLGFVPADVEIENYDRRMTEQRANELLRNCTSDHDRFADACAEAEAVLFCGGALYRATMRRAARRTGPHIIETDGGGIGHQRAQLGAWLERHYAALAAKA